MKVGEITEAMICYLLQGMTKAQINMDSQLMMALIISLCADKPTYMLGSKFHVSPDSTNFHTLSVSFFDVLRDTENKSGILMPFTYECLHSFVRHYIIIS